MDWWLPALCVAITLARLYRTRTNVLLGEVQRQSQQWRLPLSWGVHEDAMARSRRIARGDALGTGLGFGLGLLVEAARGGGDYPYAAMIGLVLGTALGAAVAAVTTLPRRTARARVTHASAVSLADFQPRWFTALALGVPAAAIAVTATSLVRLGHRPGWGDPLSDAGILGVAALVGVGAHLVVCRSALRAPRDARTDLELAWQDGYLGHAVALAGTVPITAGAGALLVLAFPPPSYGIALAIAALLVLATWLSAHPQRTFRRRLWNNRVFELEPDDLVGPTAAAARS